MDLAGLEMAVSNPSDHLIPVHVCSGDQVVDAAAFKPSNSVSPSTAEKTHPLTEIAPAIRPGGETSNGRYPNAGAAIQYQMKVHTPYKAPSIQFGKILLEMIPSSGPESRIGSGNFASSSFRRIIQSPFCATIGVERGVFLVDGHLSACGVSAARRQNRRHRRRKDVPHSFKSRQSCSYICADAFRPARRAWIRDVNHSRFL